MTGSSDTMVRLWDVDTGTCKQVLEGHKEEIFSCAFNYDGNTIITASKDNTCRIWKVRVANLNNESSSCMPLLIRRWLLH